MAHAQRLDFVFQRKGPVHSKRRGCQLSQALAGEVCTSQLLLGSNAGQAVIFCLFSLTSYPLHSPVSPTLPLPCVTVCHQVSTGLYPEKTSSLDVLTKRPLYLMGGIDEAISAHILCVRFWLHSDMYIRVPCFGTRGY
jgi:hypothetical protein